MAWAVNGKELKMAEGDWGIQLPITVSGVTFTEQDMLRFVFKDKMNGSTILTKEYAPVENTVSLELTEAETELFSVGTYVYLLDWYQDGAFLCNVIPSAFLKVVDKA